MLSVQGLGMFPPNDGESNGKDRTWNEPWKVLFLRHVGVFGPTLYRVGYYYGGVQMNGMESLGPCKGVYDVKLFFVVRAAGHCRIGMCVRACCPFSTFGVHVDTIVCSKCVIVFQSKPPRHESYVHPFFVS